MAVEPGWVFHEIPRMGGASSGAWLTPLSGSGLVREHALAREAIQNSCDAQLEGETVLMRFQRRRVTGQASDRLVSAFKLAAGPLTRLGSLGLEPGNGFERLGDQISDRALDLLFIEDFHTHGLGGKPSGRVRMNDHFLKLCLWVGIQDTTEAAENRGGSFGYGKSVYLAASDVRTVVFYSVFEATEDTEGHHARLFAVAIFGEHEFDGGDYDGRAWFGVPGEGSSCSPVTDEDAHRLAEALGFERRAPEEVGTSILVIGSTVDLDKLREGIESFWWPRMRDKNLAIELLDGDEALPPPSPLARQDLRPFLRCYDIVSNRATADADAGERAGRLNRRGDEELGTWAFKRLENGEELAPESEGDVERTDAPASLRNTIALLRGPRMVVDYAKLGSDSLEHAAGVFVAHDDVRAVLRLSEPPAHNRWDPNSGRLDSEEAATVWAVLNRVGRNFLDFQRGLMPAVQEHFGRLPLLEKLLAQFMSSQVKTTPPPPPRPGPHPFQINLKQERITVDGHAAITSQVTLSLKPTAGMDSLRVRVRMEPMVLANDNRTSDETLGLAELKGPGDPTGEDPTAVVLELDKTNEATVSGQSVPFDPEWDAQLRVSVEAIDDGGAANAGVPDPPDGEAHR